LATTTSCSLRTTIPVEIVSELRIKKGDVLDWSVQSLPDGKLAVVRKME
jgi:bifunctional DNA-binding transcriptional regulator/antitoxin component of YhaV-PrlF toxin-antitoxin module